MEGLLCKVVLHYPGCVLILQLRFSVWIITLGTTEHLHKYRYFEVFAPHPHPGVPHES